MRFANHSDADALPSLCVHVYFVGVCVVLLELVPAIRATSPP